MTTHNKIIVICGTSGSGKGSVIRGLMGNKKLNLYWAKTATTRTPRPDDSKTSRRIFLSRDEFEKLWRDGEIIERNVYNGALYGALKSEIEKYPKRTVIVETDINGALALKEYYGKNCLTIFLLVTPRDTERRLRKRGMPDNVISTRLKIAQKEIEMRKLCDKVIVNREGKLEQAIAEVTRHIRGFWRPNEVT
ncbi:MAG: hypothetical protein AAB787_00335 [Patescibacteria group bacterium]